MRRRHGAMLLDAAVGPIDEVRAVGDPRRWVALTFRHANGAVSQLALSGDVPRRGAGTRESFDLYGPDGALSLDFDALGADSADGAARWSAVRSEFATAVRTGRPHPLDVHRGLYLQRIIDAAVRDLDR